MQGLSCVFRGIYISTHRPFKSYSVTTDLDGNYLHEGLMRALVPAVISCFICDPYIENDAPVGVPESADAHHAIPVVAFRHYVALSSIGQ